MNGVIDFMTLPGRNHLSKETAIVKESEKGQFDWLDIFLCLAGIPALGPALTALPARGSIAHPPSVPLALSRANRNSCQIPSSSVISKRVKV